MKSSIVLNWVNICDNHWQVNFVQISDTHWMSSLKAMKITKRKEN